MNTPNIIPNFVFLPGPVLKEMEAEEFIEFAENKRHLIRDCWFVPAGMESRGFGKFIVEIEDDNLQSN